MGLRWPMLIFRESRSADMLIYNVDLRFFARSHSRKHNNFIISTHENTKSMPPALNSLFSIKVSTSNLSSKEMTLMNQINKN